MPTPQNANTITKPNKISKLNMLVPPSLEIWRYDPTRSTAYAGAASDERRIPSPVPQDVASRIDPLLPDDAGAWLRRADSVALGRQGRAARSGFAIGLHRSQERE